MNASPIPASEPLLRAEEVTRVYGSGPTRVEALRGVSLAVWRGEVVALQGRSGSGKTTLLNLLGGLDRPTSGRIFLGNLELSRLPEAELTRIRRRHIGFVFQAFALHPLLSAEENVELPLRFAGVPARERRERARRWLAYVGLDARRRHRPFELSGGEQQRVAIARALAAEPDLILADEPTGQLDSATGARILQLLRQVAREQQITIVMTSHDPAIPEFADRVYTLVDGRLVEPAANSQAM
ncbi:MAG: ABC transporter ATP-binding protein [Bacillota bacterium]